ncbi:MAG TPA: hypothetical protein VIW29_00670 [Polyangiaceae bacterium]
MHQQSFALAASALVGAFAFSVPALAQLPLASAPVRAPTTTPPQRDAERDKERSASVRERWLLAVEGVTHAPIDLGIQLGIETPPGLRLFAGFGWVPGGYMDLLTSIASSASSSDYAHALLDESEYSGRTWRLQAGFRPWRSIGLYADVGYAQLLAKATLNLASSSIADLARLGGGYLASTRLDMWLVELGYQGQLDDRLVLGMALGAMGTFAATTSIAAVDGAPSSSTILRDAASQADRALEKYGILPTLTLRLGFDLL